MKKSEILKLKPGSYLVTDDICNYTYVLKRYDDSKCICNISQRGSISFDSVFLHYDIIKDFDDEYERFVPRKRMDANINVGGISVRLKGAYGVYSKLNLIGVYNANTFKKEMNRFSLNHKINMSRYDRKGFKRVKL